VARSSTLTGSRATRAFRGSVTTTARAASAPTPASTCSHGAHRAVSNLKAWLHGTHRSVGDPDLQDYLDEYVFRHNRRRAPMAACQTLLGLEAQRPPTTYDQITRGDQAAS